MIWRTSSLYWWFLSLVVNFQVRGYENCNFSNIFLLQSTECFSALGWPAFLWLWARQGPPPEIRAIHRWVCARQRHEEVGRLYQEDHYTKGELELHMDSVLFDVFLYKCKCVCFMKRSCCGSVDKTTDSQSWGPQFESAGSGSSSLGQGTLSSLPSPSQRA